MIFLLLFSSTSSAKRSNCLKGSILSFRMSGKVPSIIILLVCIYNHIMID